MDIGCHGFLLGCRRLLLLPSCRSRAGGPALAGPGAIGEAGHDRHEAFQLAYQLVFIQKPLVRRNNIICANNGVDATSRNVHGLRRAPPRRPEASLHPACWVPKRRISGCPAGPPAVLVVGWQYRRLVTVQMLYLMFVRLFSWMVGAENLCHLGRCPQGHGSVPSRVRQLEGWKGWDDLLLADVKLIFLITSPCGIAGLAAAEGVVGGRERPMAPRRQRMTPGSSRRPGHARPPSSSPYRCLRSMR